MDRCLPSEYELSFPGQSEKYTIGRVIGRGASTVAYSARNEQGCECILKEHFPHDLDIERAASGELKCHRKDMESFERGKLRFRFAGNTQRAIRNSIPLRNATPPARGLLEANNTLYLKVTSFAGKTFDRLCDQPLITRMQVCLAIAELVLQYHKNDLLCLDLKPDNIFVLEKPSGEVVTDFVVYIDFDSVRKKNELSFGRSVAFTALWSAPEQRNPYSYQKICQATDIYTLGELVFWSVFGRHSDAGEQRDYSTYPFEHAAGAETRRALSRTAVQSILTELFHSTLRASVRNRYPSADALIRILKNLIDALSRKEYIVDSVIRPKGFFVGRADEMKQMDDYLRDNDILFLSGIGGIGKSSLVQEYLLTRSLHFHTVLYMQFRESMENTISNDVNINITTLKQSEATRDGIRYFDKKLQKIRELVRGTPAIIVINNFYGEVDHDMRAILETDWKIVIVSRQAPVYRDGHVLNLSAISDRSTLQHVFEHNLGRQTTPDEQPHLNSIIEGVAGHTLALELIAKQMANSRLSISEVSALTQRYGFSSVAHEKVDYEKDGLTYWYTVGSMIDALFEASALSPEKKTMLKIASLLGISGMDIDRYQHILQLESKTCLYELSRDGWLMLRDGVLSMHPVIQEAVHRWHWEPPYLDAAERFLTYFYVEIRMESTKNNYPKKLRDRMVNGNCAASQSAKASVRHKMFAAWRDRSPEREYLRQGLMVPSGERCARMADNTPADTQKLVALLLQSEEILSRCKREEMLRRRDAYGNLLYITVLHMPRYRESYILSELSQILAERKAGLAEPDTAEPIGGCERRNPVTMMQLYALAVSIHVEEGNFDMARGVLDEAMIYAKDAHHSMAYALYYDTLSGYYDGLLDGAYDSEDPEDVKLRCRLLEAIKKTLHFSKRYKAYDINHLYVKSLLAKATILMRHGYGSKGAAKRLIELAKKEVEANTLPYADVRLSYYLVCGWYYALIAGRVALVDAAVSKAQELSSQIATSDLDEIDNVLVPCANMYLEAGRYGNAEKLISDGIRLCDRHEGSEQYARVTQRLNSCLADIMDMARGE